MSNNEQTKKSDQFFGKTSKDEKCEFLKREIKGTFPKDGGEVKYNISYPELCIKGKNKKEKDFLSCFNGFYKQYAENFLGFAKTKLYREALRMKEKSEDFEPFGAVLKYFCSYNYHGLISIVTDASVYSGKEQQTKRTAQNWHIDKARLLVFEDFFTESDKKQIIIGIKNEIKLREAMGISRPMEKNIDSKIKKYFSKNDFYLTPKGYGFFYPSGCIWRSTAPDVFFLLGFKGNGFMDPYGNRNEKDE